MIGAKKRAAIAMVTRHRGWMADEVAPRDTAQYFCRLRELPSVVGATHPEASEKVRKGNYQRLFDAARGRVRAWERARGW